MNKRLFLDTLRQMKGKSFVYANKTFQILDYSIDDHRSRVTIKTDKRVFERTYDEADEFLTYFSPVTEAEVIETETVDKGAVTVTTSDVQANEVVEEHKSLTKELIDVLRDNIAKVKKDKNYIAQAQAINNNVNSIINVTKLQLDVYKQFKGKKTNPQ